MNVKEKYTQLLEVVRFPATPIQLPRQVQLSAEFLGNLPKAIALTMIHDVEFDQEIFWEGNAIIAGQLRRGRTESIGSDSDWLKYLFGRKPLAYFHTHTTDEDESKSYEFSSFDIADYRANPRQSYFQLCGSDQGITAVFQTRKSAHLLFSSFIGSKLIERHLDKSNFELASQRKQAKILEGLGFGYYIWRPLKSSIREGELENGILLTRIRSR